MVKKPYTITAVEYLNTALFVDGLRNSNAVQQKFDLILDNPSACSRRMINGEANIGLVPVATIIDIEPNFILKDYCIGASGPVRTVKLFSQVPVFELKEIIVDSHSETSVKLLEVLCRELWKTEVKLIRGDANFLSQIYSQETGILAIGDKVFGIENKFSYSYDLAESWIELTSTDFVFACWLSQVDLPSQDMDLISSALRSGIENKTESVRKWSTLNKYKDIDIEQYLNKNISYSLDVSKRKGLMLFLELADLSPNTFVFK